MHCPPVTCNFFFRHQPLLIETQVVLCYQPPFHLHTFLIYVSSAQKLGLLKTRFLIGINRDLKLVNYYFDQVDRLHLSKRHSDVPLIYMGINFWGFIKQNNTFVRIYLATDSINTI